MPFEFDAATHTYTLDGMILPSVTQVLEGVGVIDYSHIPPSTRQMALARGSAVHAATHYDDEGDLGEMPEGLGQYLAAWREFRERFISRFELIEHRSYLAEHRYAGTLDRLAEMKAGGMAMIDIKTGTAPDWVRLQLGAYTGFLPEPRLYRRLCVELRPDGTYRVIEFPAGQWRKDFLDFLACLRVYRMRNEFNHRKDRAA